VTRLALVSDTHLPRGARRLPEACVARLRAADLVIHAGDLVREEVLDALEALGPPVRAVHGNVDEPALQARLPAELVLDLDGVRLAVVHDAGPARGRAARMRRRFPDAHAVVFGHSHVPLHEVADDGLVLFNPGSPTDRRRQPRHTMGAGRTQDGALELELVALD
jgi:hypothetical protein